MTGGPAGVLVDRLEVAVSPLYKLILYLYKGVYRLKLEVVRRSSMNRISLKCQLLLIAL